MNRILTLFLSYTKRKTNFKNEHKNNISRFRVCLCSLFDGEPLKGASLKPKQTKEFLSRKRSLSQSEPLHLGK